MHQCDEMGADMIIDGAFYQIDNLAECKNLARLRGGKGVIFTNYPGTLMRLEQQHKGLLRQRREEQKLKVQIVEAILRS